MRGTEDKDRGIGGIVSNHGLVTPTAHVIICLQIKVYSSIFRSLFTLE
jgi:hypothetical protein